AVVFEQPQLRKPTLDGFFLNGPVLADPADGAVRQAVAVGEKVDHAAAGVTAQKGNVDPRRDRRLHVMEHVEGPVLVVPDRQPGFRAQEALGVRVRVQVADVGDVVTFLLHPEGEREFPEQEFAGPLRQGCIEDLAIFAIGPIPAYAHAGPPVPFFFAVIVEGPLARPAIVCRPRRVTALEEEVAFPVVTDNEDNVALKILVCSCQLAEVDATWPILWYGQANTRLPLAFAQALGSNGGVGLGLSRKGPKME